MDVEPRPDNLPSGSRLWSTMLGDLVERIVAGVLDLIDPVGWAVEIIGGLLDLLA